MRDITERKWVEEALRQSEERFRSVLDNSPDVIYRFNLQTRRYEYFSPACTMVYGFTPDEMITMTEQESWDRVHSDDRPGFEAAMARILEAGQGEIEIRWFHRSGYYIWLLISIHITTNAGGQPAYRDGIVLDITRRREAEDALRLSEERFRLALRNAPVSVAVQNRDLVFTWAYNQRTRQTDEIVGKTDIDLFAPEDVAWLVPLKQRVIRTGTEERVKNWITSNGRRMYLDLYLEPIWTNNGEITGVGIAAVDLTDLKLAEESLRETTQYLDNLINYANAPIIVWDPAFRITRFNHAFEELTGMMEKEALGQQLPILFPEPFRDAAMDVIRRTISGEQLKVVEIPILRKDGGVRVVLWNSATLYEENGTTVFSTIAQGHDITERKIAEAKNIRAREEWEQTFNTVPDLIAILDTHHRIIRVNKAMADRLRTTPDKCIGLACHEVVHGTAVPPEFCPHAKTCTDGKQHIAEVHEPGLGGTFIVSTTPLTDQAGNMLGTVHVAHDITDRKRAEEELKRRHEDLRAAYQEITSTQEELHQNLEELSLREQELTLSEASLRDALAEKEILLSEIHHRVKNNLTAFISLLSLDGTYEDTESGRALKKDLQNRARSMALIHETLYRTGKFSNVEMENYLTTLVSQIAGSYAGSGKIRTVVEAGGTNLDLARATTAGLIINELVTNSFKYAFPPGFDCMALRGEPCTIRVSLLEEDGRYVLSVGDNGCGLPAGLDPLATKSLGLKLVNFLARHQLRADVSVREIKGTGFIFRFHKTEDYT
jgi:PAS domain S-box-containing protein